ncbi:MAG: SWIM zinc finger family protein [Chloroflexi bacterium]|nr:SWIM zinc finger family protein [Chloroflexota bacterium]
MNKPTEFLSFLTEALVRQYASPESFYRGQEYYQDGAVISLARRGRTLQAEIEGSQPEPYFVRVVADAAGIAEANCDCPYDWGGWCKHIVATLLACIHQPDSVEERPTVEELLSGLDREQLQRVLLRLVDDDPSVVDILDEEISLLKSDSTETPIAPTQPAIRRTSLDTTSIRRQVRTILHSLDRMRPSEAYWHVGNVVGDVRRVLGQAWDFVEVGDGSSAILILEAITEEYMDGFEQLDDSNGEVGAFFDDLGEAWTEALLTAELSPEQREAWAEKLAGWADVVGEYGIDNAFYAAEAAAVQGWDHPVLQRALEGKVAVLGWAEEAVDWPEGLVDTMLNVLERQERYEEYLNLARVAGQTQRCAIMLVRLGRVQDAVDYCMKHLESAEDALAVSKALREREEVHAALGIAEHGVALDGQNAPLAVWLRDLASSLGEIDRALAAAKIAFRADPNLVAYLRTQELAGQSWLQIRADLLDHLRKCESYYPRGQVEVFLHEGLVADAIAAVDGTSAHELIAQVVDAAIATNPDWVIRTCRRQAEPIIDQGKAQHYDDAVRWLAKARDAYRVVGKEQEWRTYLEDLIADHRRKYKLLPMLVALRHP